MYFDVFKDIVYYKVYMILDLGHCFWEMEIEYYTKR